MNFEVKYNLSVDVKLNGQKVLFEQLPENKIRVTLPDGIPSLGQGEIYHLSKINENLKKFNGCEIAYIKLPSTLKVIEGDAFWLLRSLEEISIPASVEEIRNCAFDGCRNLKKITFLEDENLPNNTSIKSIGCFAFRNTGIKKITIPASVQDIDYYAFEGCRDLTDVEILGGKESVTLPENMKKYGSTLDKTIKNIKE